MVVAPLYPRVPADCEDLMAIGGGRAEVTLDRDGEELILTVKEKDVIAQVILDREAVKHLQVGFKRYFKALGELEGECRAGY